MDLLQQLLEQQAVIDTINSLFIETDNRNWPAAKNCLAEKVLFDMSSLTGEAPSTLTSEQITNAWSIGLKDLKAIHHQAGNYRVELKNNEADAFCYGIASHYKPNPTNNNVRTFVGSYNFHLLNIAGAWKIDHFKFNLKYIDGNLQL